MRLRRTVRPRGAAEFAGHAEPIGLIVAVADRFQLWRHHGGHGPSALTWLGAAAGATEHGVAWHERPHPHPPLPPVRLAQSFATLGLLAPGRPVPPLGTGEAMNETPATGQESPGRKERRLRLAEAIRLIR